MTVDQQIGKSLVIDANILGGLHLEAKRVSLLVKKGGVQMFKETWSTELINNAHEFKFILNDTFEVNPESLLYKNIISQFLTPLNTRTGKFDLYVNKKDKNVVLNKFYAKGKVMKNGINALKLLMTTNEQPYKLELFAPAVLGDIKPGMTEAKISVPHNPEKFLQMKTNLQTFTGFKIYKSGSGNENNRMSSLLSG